MGTRYPHALPRVPGYAWHMSTLLCCHSAGAPQRALGLRLLFLLSSLCGLACSTTEQGSVARPPARAASVHTGSAPIGPTELYSADEALKDVLSGPLEHVATGRWPGVDRMYACVFRNKRVLVVNVYCTRRDPPAFSVNVYSPTRGRARIYAESRGPVSAQMRQDYFTFTAESEPPPGAETGIRPPTLAMSLLELYNYDVQRQRAFLPACYGGTELGQERSGCLGTLAPRAGEWAARNRDFLAHASDDWYRLVRELRSQAAQHGKEPDK